MADFATKLLRSIIFNPSITEDELATYILLFKKNKITTESSLVYLSGTRDVQSLGIPLIDAIQIFNQIKPKQGISSSVK